MPPLPPERSHGERKPHDPCEPQPDHAEQHPGADRAGGRLAREARAASRVDGERDEERSLREHPVHVEEPPVALGARDELRTEDRADVDLRQRKVVRHGRA